MLIHPKNVGRQIVLKNGRAESIVEVLANKESFRIGSEKFGPVVNDYSFSDIQSAKRLIISADEGVSWFVCDLSRV